MGKYKHTLNEWINLSKHSNLQIFIVIELHRFMFPNLK